MYTAPRLFLVCSLSLIAFTCFGQEEAVVTSATDHSVRIEKVKRVNPVDSRAPERHGKSIRKRKNTATSSTGKEARVYKRHRHFAQRDIRLRSKSKVVRRETLGVGTE